MMDFINVIPDAVGTIRGAKKREGREKDLTAIKHKISGLWTLFKCRSSVVVFISLRRVSLIAGGKREAFFVYCTLLSEATFK